jgi:DNA-binding NtrC family response regulator
VDDERANLELFRRCFDEAFTVHTATSGPEALRLLEEEADIGVLISDQRMDPMTGIELLTASERSWPLLTRMLLTAYSDRDLLLQAIQRGRVHDYVLKPWAVDDLSLRLHAAVDAYAQRRAQASAAAEREAQRSAQRDDEMVSAGGLRIVSDAIRRVANAPSSVMILGESGTGKELVARAIHAGSSRRRGPFISVNCGALPAELVESELFGYERGAHSTATVARAGRFEQADGGTLFLDEIGDMPLNFQVRLLRAIESREVQRLGAGRSIRVNIRLITATHRQLRDMVAAGTFREDLYQRVAVVPIEVPPLRARPEDIDALARHFLAQFNTEFGKHITLSGQAMAALHAYDWPGNVRELRNTIERATVMNDAHCVLEAEDFTFDMARAMQNAQRQKTPRQEADEEEKARYRELLRRRRGNVTQAALEEGVPRTTFTDRARKHGLL